MTNRTYPAELYRNNHYRVVHGPEEDRDCQAKGWKEEKTEGQEYVANTSGIPEDVPEETPAKRAPGRPKKKETDLDPDA